jgi:hypothetical protein
MLPIIKGLIARRVLLNFRADAQVVQSMLPKPFVVEPFQGAAIVGVCLIRLEQLRPKGLPSQLGITSENVAHRVAVRYPLNGEMRSGVYIWRRETDQKLVQWFGGRLFPGVHHGAEFFVQEDDNRICTDVQSVDGATDVHFDAKIGAGWLLESKFATLQEASGFFKQGGCGFSSTLSGKSLEGMELRISQWSVSPLTVQLKKVSFFGDQLRFPEGSVEFDCGLLMRGVPHEWHGMREMPRLEQILDPSTSRSTVASMRAMRA